MKFYNPFKAHVVTCGDKYLVRRLSYFLWTYKEKMTFRNDEPHWWYMWEYVNKHCICDTLAQAQKLRDEVWVDPNKKPKIKMKVIHG
jgi:hypothetical protein